MEPYYDLDETTRYIIKELAIKCTELQLGNISFSYSQQRIDFCMTENRDGWEFTVSQDKGKRDVYAVIDGDIYYRYSE